MNETNILNATSKRNYLLHCGFIPIDDFQPEFSTTIFRSDEVLSVSTSNLSGNSVPALIRHGSESSLPTNLWSQRASVSIDSEATEDDEADRRGSLVNESSPRRGSKLLDFLDKKKKDKKRYKDKQGKGVSDLKKLVGIIVEIRPAKSFEFLFVCLINRTILLTEKPLQLV